LAARLSCCRRGHRGRTVQSLARRVTDDQSCSALAQEARNPHQEPLPALSRAREQPCV